MIWAAIDSENRSMKSKSQPKLPDAARRPAYQKAALCTPVTKTICCSKPQAIPRCSFESPSVVPEIRPQATPETTT